MIQKWVAQVSAWLVALYAVEVLVPIIDILGLPLPRDVGLMSFSTVFILTALGMLIPLARQRRILVLGNAGLALIGLLIFWAGLEVIIATTGYASVRFDLVLAYVPLLLVIVAARLHLRLFGDPQLLVSALVLTASLLVLAHTVLLLVVSLDIPVPFVNIGELRGRNAMALLMPLCLWLLIFFPLKGWPVFAPRYNLLLALALTNILLSSARSALLILLWCVLTGLALRLPPLRRWQLMSLAPAGLIVVVGTMLAYPILLELGDLTNVFVGLGDNAISAWSRSQSNAMLLDKLAQDVLLGIGWGEVAATKAYGYMGHTLYVNVLAAYGVIGMLAAAWLLTLGLLRTRGDNREVAAHLLFLVVLIISFSNNVFAYLGVIIALIEADVMPRVYSEGLKNDCKNSLLAQ